MIYRNGEPTVYAKENKGLTTADNSPEPFETIYKKVVPENYEAPSDEDIKKAAEEPQNKEAVEVTDEPLEITKWDDKETVFNDTREGLEPGDTDKYTIVMWIEGEDPECIDDIRSGYVKLEWFFGVVDEEL
jgi:sulfatase maturation enzyme AslB (radical SAM superfamily)